MRNRVRNELIALAILLASLPVAAQEVITDKSKFRWGPNGRRGA